MENNKPLQRKIGLTTATAIVIANMVGTGIFTTTGFIAGYLPNSMWVLFCWLLGGIIALSGALCYAELATRMPQVGGEYVYLKKLYHPALGFLTGWTSFFVGFSAPIAGAAISFAAYFMAGTNGAFANGVLTSAQVQKILAIAVVLLFTAVHYLGVKPGSVVQNVLTALKILIIAGLSLAGIWLGGDGTQLFPNEPLSISVGGFGVALMFVMFSYSGWNASAYIAGEMVHPGKTLPRSLIIGTTVVIALYLLLNFFVLNELSFSQIEDTIAIVEKASTQAFGTGIGDTFGLLISIALLSSLSAFIVIGPRVYYAMAGDNQFFSFAGRVHPRYGVPGYSIIVQGMVASFMILIGTFEQLLVYIGFALNVFPWLAVLGLFKARKRKIGESTAVKIRAFPLAALFFLASSFFIMVTAVINKPVESGIAVLTVAAGVPIYFLLQKRKRIK